MEVMQWLSATPAGKFVFTMLVSMIPVVELRGGIPFGVATLGQPYPVAFAAAVLGNILPTPFILVYIRRIFHWMRRAFPRLGRVVDALERRAGEKGKLVNELKYFGLFLLVAIPLPGTGAWTGALVAALMDMPLRKAIPTIILGVMAAGLIMTALTSVGVGAFGG